MFCDMCGKELPENAVYCMFCGSTVGKNTQPIDAYDLSLFSRPTPKHQPNYQDARATVITSLENMQRMLYSLLSTIQNLQEKTTATHTTLLNLGNALKAANGTFLSLQGNPAFRGAPMEEFIHSHQQMLAAIQSQDLAVQHNLIAAQELERVLDTVLQSTEAMSTWLKEHA